MRLDHPLERGEQSHPLRRAEPGCSAARLPHHRYGPGPRGGVSPTAEAVITVRQDAAAPATLVLKTDTGTFPPEGGTLTIPYQTNQSRIAWSEAPGWINVEHGTDALLFTATANDTQAARSTLLTVTAGSDDNTVAVPARFTQEPLPPFHANAFVYTIRTAQDGQSVALPAISSDDASVSFVIDYGDGSPAETVAGALTSAMTHTYADAGEYRVEIVSESRITAFSMAKHKELVSVDDNRMDWSGLRTLHQAFMQCSALESIPSNLFATCTGITEATRVFMDCKALREVPERLFAACAEVETFEYCFRGCTALETVGAGLFAGCTAARYYDGLFIDCSRLRAIPEGLFDDSPEACGFNYTFQNNTSLTSIPEGLFDRCKAITGLDFCFSRCTNLTGESPYTLHGEHKVHLYERERYPDYYPTPPMTAMACFMECRGLSDAAYIALNHPDWINY